MPGIGTPFDSSVYALNFASLLGTDSTAGFGINSGDFAASYSKGTATYANGRETTQTWAPDGQSYTQWTVEPDFFDLNGSSSQASAQTSAGIAAAVGAAAQGISQAIARRAQGKAYEYQASMYEMQAESARLNQRAAKIAVGNAYRSGEYENMRNGLQWAQKIANQRASTAGRGVAMNQGSANEIEASMRMAARQDYYSINQKMMDEVWAARDKMLAAQMAENTALGNAKAADAMADFFGSGALMGFGLMQFGGNALMSYASMGMSEGLNLFGSFGGK